jgi:hypothetical protein
LTPKTAKYRETERGTVFGQFNFKLPCLELHKNLKVCKPPLLFEHMIISARFSRAKVWD